MITLSYSSLNMIHNQGHQWTLKQMGVVVPDNRFLEEGKVGHRLIQGHVAGDKKVESLTAITHTFPIVERVDFDKNCKFERYYKSSTTTYSVIGFVDGLNNEAKQMLEIKLSSSKWSSQKFIDSYQRKLYAWAYPALESAVLVTGSRDPEKWAIDPPKVIEVPMTQKDRDDAAAWLSEGVRLLETGEFMSPEHSGLDENGQCADRWCLYGTNCVFKRGL